jgi:hypothetical protein
MGLTHRWPEVVWEDSIQDLETDSTSTIYVA